MEREEIPICEIRETTMADIVAFRHMQTDAWLATYPSLENGVSEEWVKAQVDSRLSEEGLERSKNFIAQVLADPSQLHRVAVQYGKVIGFVHASTLEDGTKEIKAIYVSPSVFRKGVGMLLMKAVDQWIDGVEARVTVATYNKRATRFYEKNGFKTVPGSESTYKETIPVIDMIRKAEVK